MFELNEVLVPVDFSAASEKLVAEASHMVSGPKPVIVLQHVVDPQLADWAESAGIGQKGDVLPRMRAQASSGLKAMAGMVEPGIEVTTIVSEGVPFYEIVRLAEELDVDAVVIAKGGMRARPEQLFFGSTAERVVRACNRPVIVLPVVLEQDE